MGNAPRATVVGVAVLAVWTSAMAEQLRRPVAHYTFDEGKGDVLHDRSGNGHHGKIVDAKWVKRGERWWLRFDGHGDYVDFGDNRDLKITGDMTILAWVHLDASPCPDDKTNWTVIDCEDYQQEGFILRVYGAGCKVFYRESRKGSDGNGFGATQLENHRAYLLGVVRRAGTATVYLDGAPDVQFRVAPPVFGRVPFKIGSTDQSFNGTIDEVVIYDRALTTDEVAAHYWRSAAAYGKDVSIRGRLAIRPFIYADEDQARFEVDWFGASPIASDEHMVVELTRHDGKVLVSRPIAKGPDRCKEEHAFDVGKLPPGKYELRAILRGPTRTVRVTIPFDRPMAPFPVPSPDRVIVGPLPQSPRPPDCRVRTTAGGGFVVSVGGESLAVESAFSFPNGGDNKLVCAAAPDKGGESEWRVTAKRVAPSTWQVDARGRHYAISRRVQCRASRILVADTITNTTDHPVGIILGNRLTVAGSRIDAAHLAGKKVTTPTANCALKICPTIFLAHSGLGVGMVALDDVFIVQSRGTFDGRGVTLGSNEFAIDAGASYTLEWAVYANATGDYYDFINAVRRDEGRNNVTVEGALAMIKGTQQKRDPSLVPDSRYFEVRNANCATVYCLAACTDDPTISLQSFEFVEYPKERERIRAMMDALRAVRPDIKGMFHVAQQLYSTNQPDRYFPDSRVVDADGKQAIYTYDYGNGAYFSRERYEEGWRWWIYYPTLDNSYGAALLDSADVMMDELGCRGVFVDGFLWGYGGEYTYNRWDGHSADVDPKTKTIARKKGSTLLLTQDAMIVYCRKIWGKGGVVIANNVIPTRTICSLPLIVEREIKEGPDVHLVPTPIALGNMTASRTEVGVYHDVLSKLRWGNLYFYYGEPKTLTYESVPKQMFPITVQEVHGGTVKGKERLVTMNSGVYGWAGDRSLHVAFRYDSRGHRVRPDFLTTVDASSVRTRVDLGQDEAAVVVRIPVRIESTAPVNVVVDRYDDQALSMTVNGRGTIEVHCSGQGAREFSLTGQRQIHIP